MKVVKRNNVWFPSIFDELFNENRLDVPNYENFSIPAVNIQENFANFVIELAAPGLKKENFSIEVDDMVLNITSEVASKSDSKEQETSEKEKETKYTRKEFNYTSFKRSFNLPENVNTEDIKASYENGVLTIALAKKEEQKEIKRMVEIS